MVLVASWYDHCMNTVCMRNVIVRELRDDLQSELYFMMSIISSAIAEELYATVLRGVSKLQEVV